MVKPDLALTDHVGTRPLAKGFFALALTVFFGISGFSQGNQVVYLKHFPFASYLEAAENPSIYVLSTQTSDSEVDVGIFNEQQVQFNSDYAIKRMVYDSVFSILTLFEESTFGTSPNFRVHSSQDRVYGKRQNLNYSAFPVMTSPDLEIEIPISSYLWEYQYEDQVMVSLGLVQNPFATNAIIPFSNARFSFNLRSADISSNPMILYDDVIVAVSNLYGEHVIGEEEFSVEQQYGYVWFETDISTGSKTYTQVNESEEGGSVLSFGVHPAMDQNSIYHVYLVRGNNTEISKDGTIFETASNDSFYHFRMRKENSDPSSIWDTRLFSYNNYPDSMVSRHLASSCRIDGFLEKEGAGYLSVQKSLNHSANQSQDTVVIVDFNSDTLRSADMLTYRLPGESFEIPVDYAAYSFYKIENDGSVETELSFVGSLFHETTVDQTERRRLHEVGGHLATTFQYYAANDTVFGFQYKHAGGGVDSTFLELPAGQGVVILFLDNELELADHWVIPYQGEYGLKVQIDQIDELAGDSLLIHGNIDAGVSTSLDPFGNLPAQEFAVASSFISVIAPTENLSTSPTFDNPFFKIYPNPTENNVRVRLNASKHQLDYRLTTAEGKICLTGIFGTNENFLDLRELEPGMYILSVFDGASCHSAKLIVSR